MKNTKFNTYFRKMLWPCIVEKLYEYTADVRKEMETDGFEFNSFIVDSVNPYLGFGLDIELSLLVHAPFLQYGTRKSDPFVYSRYYGVDCSVCIAAGKDGIKNLRFDEIDLDAEMSPVVHDDNIILDANLVPILSKDSMERYVERLLTHYHVAAGSADVVINLVNAIGIPIFHKRRVVPDESIFGMTVFCEDAPVSCPETHIDESGMCGRGYIVVYDDAAYNTGSMNFTVAHEIAHWILHRHHFEFATKLMGNEESFVECSISDHAPIRRSTGDRQVYSLLERQANLFASRLLAPSKQYREYLDKIIDLLKDECSRLEIARRAIKLTSTKFGLSLTAGRIRAVECGCAWARGIGLRHDNSPVEDYIVTAGMIGNDETCEISWKRFRELCREDTELNLAMETRAIVWVDNHVVINDFKYVRWGKAWPELTIYAREHANDCFLVFKTQPSLDEFYETLPDWSGVALRGDGCWSKRDVIGIQKENSKKPREEIFEKARKRKEEIEKFNAILKNDNLVRGEKLSHVISAAGFTQDKLMTVTGLRERSLSKMCSRDCGEHVDCLSVIAICVGLALPYQVSDELLRKLRCPLGEDMDGYAEYLNILNDPSQMRVWQWNCYLLEQDCLPLTDMFDDDYTKLEGKMPDNRKKMLRMYRERKQSTAILDNGNDEQSE